MYNGDNKYINEYLRQQQQGQQQQLPSIPRQMTQFGTPQRIAENTEQNDKYSGINVLDAPIMKRTLEAEKVTKTDAKTLFNELTTASKSREQIDAELQKARETAKTNAPVTIKVEKKNIVNIDEIDAKRQQEDQMLATMAAAKKMEAAPAMLASMTIQKKEPSKLEQEIALLMQRREMDMKNIQYR
jgi:hypothetical protein